MTFYNANVNPNPNRNNTPNPNSNLNIQRYITGTYIAFSNLMINVLYNTHNDIKSLHSSMKKSCIIIIYCISCYFRVGFIFANFASQTLAKISTSIHVYLYSNDNIRKIVKLTTRELPQKSKHAKITVRENNGLYSSTYNKNYALYR